MAFHAKKLQPSDRSSLGKPKAFYEMPLSDLASRCSLVASALRTLSDVQLADELLALRERPDKGRISVAAMIGIYEAEQRRRASPPPAIDFDRTLSAALSRLERQTTAEDRQTVRQIGERLHHAGGVPATLAAIARMTEGFGERRAGLRAYILQQRWEGLIR